MSQGQPIIELRGVGKVFQSMDGEVVALEDVNISIDKGDIFGVIGMSALMLLLKNEGCKQAELYDLAQSRTAVAESVGARIPSAEEMDTSAIGDSYSAMYTMSKYDVVLETTGVAPVF
ncbi:MAG: hypothetical protein EOM14_03625, partial [Clostridia bacterium]|nr:hypothetical protein [Clostridia bacterium]